MASYGPEAGYDFQLLFLPQITQLRQP